MTYKENITAILECYFSGFKKEIIDSACNRILEQEPKTDSWSIKDVADTFKKHGLIRVQEPSGDAIDRKIISAFLSGLISDETERKKALEYINELPPVNPTKTGHWIKLGVQGEIDDQIVKGFVCSKCGAISVFRMTGRKIINGDLCPGCGAKMLEGVRT